MPKILITGNGFDLKHCLPTQYKDFISILNNFENIDKYRACLNFIASVFIAILRWIFGFVSTDLSG